MKDNPDLVQKYDDIIKDQLRKGIIEKVRTESNCTLKHFIPHHMVNNPRKATTKVRIVYDASAKTKPENNSLNECLYRDPILLQNQIGILFRFRMKQMAMVADIEKSIFGNRPTGRCKRCHQVLLTKRQRYNKCREQYPSLPLLLGTIWHYMQSLSFSSNN